MIKLSRKVMQIIQMMIQIIGKVVKRLKRAGIYIKVFMNFKVIVLIFMMIMVSAYIFSEIEVGNDYSEKKVN